MPKIPEEKKNLPKITLGGEEWAVAKMPARKIIRFGEIAIGLDLKAPTGKTLGAMYECCWLAVSTVHKKTDEGEDITLDYFLDTYPVSFDEGLAAFDAIAHAAGMEFKTATGEAQADPSPENNSSKDGTIS